MGTNFKDTCVFNSMSIVGGNSIVGTISEGYSITNYTAADRSLSASEATAGNIAATLATVITDLQQQGILK